MQFVTMAKNVLKVFLDVVLNFGLWCVFSVTCAPVILTFVTIRLIVHICTFFSSDNLILTSSNDVALVHETLDKMPVANGGIILRVKGLIDLHAFRNLFSDLFLINKSERNYQNFYCEIVKFGGYLYKRYVENVVVENHIKSRSLKPGEHVKYFLSSWLQSRFPPGQPPWEMIVINIEDSNDSYVCIRANHVLLDGYSLVHILNKLTNNIEQSKKVETRNYPKLDFQILLKLFFMPKNILQFLLTNAWTKDTFPKVSTIDKIEMLPMSWGTCDLTPLKQIRRHLNVRFPAIIYALQVGAIRKLLLETQSEETLTKFTYLSSSLPVLDSNHPKNELVNHWTGAKFQIPLRTSSAKERVLGTNRSFTRILDTNGPWLMWKFVTPWFWLLPARLAFWISFSNLSLFRYRSTMSCIPQDEKPYSLLGHSVTNVYHVPIMKDSFPQAVMLGCSSSQNTQVDFTLFGHPELVQDQESMNRVMHTYLREELECLLQECAVTSSLNWHE